MINSMRTRVALLVVLLFAVGCDEGVPPTPARSPTVPVKRTNPTRDSDALFKERQENLAREAFAKADTDDDLLYIQRRFPFTQAAADARATRVRQRIRQAMETSRKGDRDMAMRLAMDAASMAEESGDRNLIAQTNGLIALLQPPALPPPEPATELTQPEVEQPPRFPVCTNTIAGTNRPPMAGLAGFSFGMTVQQAGSVCRKAGNGIEQLPYSNSWGCPKAPIGVALSGEIAFLRTCAGNICQIAVIGAKRDNPDWRDRMTVVMNEIHSKYGEPSCITPGKKISWGWDGPGDLLGGLITIDFDGDFVQVSYASAAFFKEAAPLRERRL